jgi:hypothetical protein
VGQTQGGLTQQPFSIQTNPQGGNIFWQGQAGISQGPPNLQTTVQAGSPFGTSFQPQQFPALPQQYPQIQSTLPLGSQSSAPGTWPSWQLEPQSFGTAISEAAQQSAQRITFIAPGFSVPAVIGPQYRAFYPHIWVDRITSGNGSTPETVQAVYDSWRLDVDSILRSATRKPTEVSELMIKQLKLCWESWLRSLKGLGRPSTADGWGPGLQILQALLLQIILIEHPQEELRKVAASLEATQGHLDLGKMITQAKLVKRK